MNLSDDAVGNIFWEPNSKAPNDTWVKNDSLFILELVVAAFGSISNIFFIVHIVTSFSLWRSNSSALALSLAVADLFVCSMVMFVTALNHRSYLPKLHKVNLCIAFGIASVFVCSASTYSVVAIAMDRYICVIDPFTYYSHMPRRPVYLALAFIWGFSFFVAFVPLVTGKFTTQPKNDAKCIIKPTASYVILVSILVIFIPCVIVVAVYSHIFLLASRHNSILRKSFHKFVKHKKSTTTDWIDDSQAKGQSKEDTSNYDPYDSEKETWQRNSLRVSIKSLFFTKIITSQFRSTMTLGLIVLVFLVHWLPFGIVKILTIFEPDSISYDAQWTTLWLVLLHSCWNPYVYMISKSSKGLRFMHRCCVCSCGVGKDLEEESSVTRRNVDHYTTSFLFPKMQPPYRDRETAFGWLMRPCCLCCGRRTYVESYTMDEPTIYIGHDTATQTSNVDDDYENMRIST